MKIKQYDTVQLKDGRIGCVVEVRGEIAFDVDVGSSPADWETITVGAEDIQDIISPKSA